VRCAGCAIVMAVNLLARLAGSREMAVSAGPFLRYAPILTVLFAFVCVLGAKFC
jgi:hypothetical protein